jgi:hypothetical protein
MKASLEDIMQEKKKCRKFLELASGGPLYTKMLRNNTDPAMYSKYLGNLLEEMRFL